MRRLPEFKFWFVHVKLHTICAKIMEVVLFVMEWFCLVQVQRLESRPHLDVPHVFRRFQHPRFLANPRHVLLHPLLPHHEATN